MNDFSTERVIQRFGPLLAELELEPTLRHLVRMAMESSGAERTYLLVEKRGKLWSVATGQLGLEPAITIRFESLAAIPGLSYGLVKEALSGRAPIHLPNAGRGTWPGEEDLFETREGVALFVVPLMWDGNVEGVLYMESPATQNDFTVQRAHFLVTVMPFLALALKNSLNYGNLKRDFNELKRREPREMPADLDSEGGQVGRESDAENEAIKVARMASDLLHKMGNSLNSALLVGEELADQVTETHLDKMEKANAILSEHLGDLASFLTQDERGKLLPEFYLKLGRDLIEERRALIDQAKMLIGQLHFMRDLIRDTQKR